MPAAILSLILELLGSAPSLITDVEGIVASVTSGEANGTKALNVANAVTAIANSIAPVLGTLPQTPAVASAATALAASGPVAVAKVA
jgi:hypothetical protein